MASCTAKAVASSASRTLCLMPLLRANCSCVFELFLEQLLLVQVRVITASLEQFVVRASFDNAALAENHNLVGVLHGRSAVRNQNGCVSEEKILSGLRVHTGKSIVKNKEVRVV